MRTLIISLMVVAALPVSVSAAPKNTTITLESRRVSELAAMLPPTPRGPGSPISDRAFWGEVAKQPAYQQVVQRAAPFLTEKLPVVADGLFLEFSKNGNRRNYENVEFSRRARLAPMVLAECVENNGRFLPAINSLVSELCKEKTWVLPAHDKQLTNYNNTLVTIDLFSSALAWQLAEADYLLGDKMDPAVRSTMKQEISRRVVTPFQQGIRGQRKQEYWMTTTNNWNPVCLSGVTGAALIELPDARARAEFVAAAETSVQNFLDGFTKDGYCDEGMGYWNYGYGMYAMMAQNFRHATGGKLDLFKDPRAAAPATFGARIQIINGQAPSFADCALNAQPSGTLMWLLNRKYGWNHPAYQNLDMGGTMASLFEAMLYLEAVRDPAPPLAGASIAEAAGPRAFFPEAGVYVGRPNTSAGKALGVAFKGGNNGESHNHNDLGSYVVVVGNKSILLDPGGEVYTKRTFSAQRYDSKLLNSYGHAVPVVGGQLQREGKKFKAKVLSSNFTDTTDTVTLDISSPYDVKGLKKLTRTFEYGRQSGMFVVTDHMECDTPQTFETALISLGKYAVSDGGKSILVDDGGTKARVQVATSAPFVTAEDTIVENASAKPNRMAIKLSQPVTEATVTMVVTPQ